MRLFYLSYVNGLALSSLSQSISLRALAHLCELGITLQVQVQALELQENGH